MQTVVKSLFLLLLLIYLSFCASVAWEIVAVQAYNLPVVNAATFMALITFRGMFSYKEQEMPDAQWVVTAYVHVTLSLVVIYAASFFIS